MLACAPRISSKAGGSAAVELLELSILLGRVGRCALKLVHHLRSTLFGAPELLLDIRLTLDSSLTCRHELFHLYLQGRGFRLGGRSCVLRLVQAPLQVPARRCAP